MYVCDCNTVLNAAMKNRSDKYMIRSFTSLTKDLEIQIIQKGFHFIYNKASTALNLTMATMDIKYELVPPSNHISKNS